jgi:oligopeptide/dipeptide ABC transporter ATP-binding protein
MKGGVKMSELLTIDNLTVEFPIKKLYVPAVKKVSLSVGKGKALVILGESGSGKSVTMRSILKIHPETTRLSGSIKFKGEELLKKSESEMQTLRSNKIAMIFQDSLSSLDPLFRVGYQICETIKQHKKVSNREAKKIALELLQKVGIPSPKERLRAYPHEMSGGMRQRVVIAMALACGPELLLADEPTTALDVTIQAQILKLFKIIQRQMGTTILMVTHDIDVAGQIADDIVVMYGGVIVESGSKRNILDNPVNPYTKALMMAIPEKNNRGKLAEIEGNPPLITEKIDGCPFAPRCKHAIGKCFTEKPVIIQISETHFSACHLHSISKVS